MSSDLSSTPAKISRPATKMLSIWMTGALASLICSGGGWTEIVCITVVAAAGIAAFAGSLKSRFLTATTRLERWLLALALPAAVVCTVLARPILRLFYGTGFDPAVSSLVVLMWTLVPYGIVRYHAYLLVGAEHQRVDLWMNVAMTVVNVLLNLVLIPSMGPVGAAIATLVPYGMTYS